jgi:hypothetical protein
MPMLKTKKIAIIPESIWLILPHGSISMAYESEVRMHCQNDSSKFGRFPSAWWFLATVRAALVIAWTQHPHEKESRR